MHRSTTILLTSLLAAATLQPTAAVAVAETCQGLPATLVGTPGGRLTDTEGADVLVTNGASVVDALGGDDVVCATGDAGTRTLTWLGAGADSYLGTSGAEQEVRTSFFTDPDVAVDVVRVTSGVAMVYSGTDGLPNGDVIEIDAGTVQWTGRMTAEGRLAGGPVSTLRTVARRGDAMINAVQRAVVTEGSSARYTGFPSQEFMTSAYKGVLRYRGTNEPEQLSVEAKDTYDRIVDLRGGVDSYSSDGVGGRRSSYDGGAGRDQLRLALGRREVDADLDDGRFVVRDGKRTVRRTFDGFEDLAVGAARAKVDGTPAGEQIAVSACRATVSADGGEDRVYLNVVLTEWDRPGCPSHHGRIDGGAGDDELTGSKGRDRIFGGRGRDMAYGGSGRDTCVAESTDSCEARR
ncbi:hypothetical protein ASG76_07460 [Nocardioides sp. Soil774]|uniref:hypothetical protein n=1 Tax=Nocardioides sp. Soil774 TaxID=1736408 RepID=UPI0006FE0BD3|nr:hypothetical protein [Nocardioides sp. Soil774]KRE95475.1 hypothetical protein ASG76_07460 [Nocardioides sp. Soil774]